MKIPKLMFMLFSIVLSVYGWGQSDIAKRIEFEYQKDGRFWTFPVDEYGVVVINRYPAEERDKERWDFIRLSTDLEEESRFSLDRADRIFKASERLDDQLYFLLSHKRGESFELIQIDLIDFVVTKRWEGGPKPNTDSFIDFGITKNFIFIQGRYIFYAVNRETGEQKKIYAR